MIIIYLMNRYGGEIMKHKGKQDHQKEKKSKDKVRFGIKTKLLTLILSFVIIVFVAIFFLVFNQSEKIIINYAEDLVSSKAEINAREVETWAEGILSYLDEVQNTLTTVDLDDEEEFSYLETSVDKDESYPNGIYMGTEDGDYIDPSGWEPEGIYIVTERDWYLEGLEHDHFEFGSTYFDEMSKEYVVSATALLPDEEGKNRVASLDINLSEVSDMITSFELMDTGSAMLIDLKTDTIIAHTDPKMISKPADDSTNDSIVSGIVGQIDADNEDTFIFEASGEKYLAKIETINNTNWILASYVPRSEALGQLTTLRNSVIIGIIIAIILLVVLIERSVEFMIRPIRNMTDTIVQITGGDFTVEIEPKGQDEVTVMARHLKEFIITMRDSVSGIKNISMNLRNQAENSSEVASHLHSSTENQTESMEQLNITVDELADSTSVMAENASGLAQVVSETNDKGTEANTKMEEAINISNQGKEDMQDISQSMLNIDNSVSSLVETIQKVDDSHREINGIVDVISDIASQTNLLALNASIEAARAGESGRGFAVVAEEIRKLAESSSDSADNIMNLINSITNQMSETISTSQESVENIHESTQLINNAGVIFSDIYDKVDETGVIIQEMLKEMNYVDEVSNSVAAISEEQSAGTQEILATIEQLAEQSTQISDESRVIEDSSVEVRTASEELRDELNQFTL